MSCVHVPIVCRCVLCVLNCMSLTQNLREPGWPARRPCLLLYHYYIWVHWMACCANSCIVMMCISLIDMVVLLLSLLIMCIVLYFASARSWAGISSRDAPSNSRSDLGFGKMVANNFYLALHDEFGHTQHTIFATLTQYLSACLICFWHDFTCKEDTLPVDTSTPRASCCKSYSLGMFVSCVEHWAHISVSSLVNHVRCSCGLAGLGSVSRPTV